jgi:predicted RNase H-like HicB family nuclease
MIARKARIEMAEHTYTVRCTWDPEVEVWVAESDDVPGLATGADTLDALVDKLKVVIPELLEANGQLEPGDSSDIPFVVVAERQDRAPRAA